MAGEVALAERPNMTQNFVMNPYEVGPDTRNLSTVRISCSMRSICLTVKASAAMYMATAPTSWSFDLSTAMTLMKRSMKEMVRWRVVGLSLYSTATSTSQSTMMDRIVWVTSGWYVM